MTGGVDRQSLELSPLERAVAIALEAHAGQFDKAGAPYILHPLRIMLQLDAPEERIVALLHDVVEDSPWTLEALEEEGFSPAVLDAVDRLTRRPGEDYMDFVWRAGERPLSRAVKMADLRDNMDLSRIPAPTEGDRERVGRYRRALEQLEDLGGSR